MGWVHREVDVHKCKKPDWDKTVKRGDIWECDDKNCKMQWRVKDVKTWYDQRDNYDGGHINWEFHRPNPASYPGVTSWRDQ